MARTLYFEGAGCEGTQVNDVENCRLRTAFKVPDGREFYLELLSSCENYLRHEAPPEAVKKRYGHDYYYTCPDMIVVDFCFQLHNATGDCNTDRHPIERKRTGLAYTKANILRLVNENLGGDFTDVVVLPWLAGYRVHSGKPNRYNLMDIYTDIPERTAERNRIYHEVARDYYNRIYQSHVKANPRAAHLLSEYETWSLVKYTDKTITVRSHTYKELIDDTERVHTFRVNY